MSERQEDDFRFRSALDNWLTTQPDCETTEDDEIQETSEDEIQFNLEVARIEFAKVKTIYYEMAPLVQTIHRLLKAVEMMNGQIEQLQSESNGLHIAVSNLQKRN
jgi:hypothetical protein